ncbi:MAG: insulinase family protein [Nitrospira sp.]|nr:insulinase family protein [Nitrospira sp.]
MFIKEYLPNGIPVVIETLKNMRSVALGIWVKVGSRNETSHKNGISHFLEHMFFKGTKKRTARDIAIDIDSLGGDLNAFTSKEATTFYVKVLNEYLKDGVELLSDVFLHSTFPRKDIEKEKAIIKEEIKMVEDTPDDYIHDLFNQTIWDYKGLGQPVLGRSNTIKSFTRDDLLEHIRRYYGVKDIIISCAGDFKPQLLLDILSKNLGNLRRGSEPARRQMPDFKSKVKVFNKELSETHICLGVKGLPQASEERYGIFILNTILGGGVSSRLFQEIREKRGLAYSIYSFVASYFDTGVWGVYAGVSRKKLREVVGLIVKEMCFLKDKITEEELTRAKNHLKGNIILGLESTISRMNNIARQEIYYGRYYSSKEIMKKVNAVTLSQVKGLSERLIKKERFSVTVYGPVNEKDVRGILS